MSWWTFIAETPVFTLLWQQGTGLSEAAALAVVRSAAVLLIIAGAVTLWRPNGPLLLFVCCWQLLLATATTWNGGAFLSDLAIPAQAVRFVTPLALLLLERRHRATAPPWSTVVMLLRLSVAATFIAHGWKALQLSPPFLDYLFAASGRLLGWELPQELAETILLIVGSVDLLVACLLLVRRSSALAFYMAGWGILTAASRIVHSGWDASYEALFRAANGGAPLALALYWIYLHGRNNHSPNDPPAATSQTASAEE